MKTFLAEDFRQLIHTLSEIAYDLNEISNRSEDQPENPIDDEQKDSTASRVDQEPTTDKSIDDVMTQPAGIEKVLGRIDVEGLINLLDMPPNRQSDFKSAISALSKDTPSLSTSQAMSLAVAFSKMLNIKNQGKEIGTYVQKPQSVTETDENMFDADISENDLVAVLRKAGENGPNAKAIVSELIGILVAGMKERNAATGLHGIFNAIKRTIELSMANDRKNLLVMLDDFENHYEGDEHAFDQKTFAELMLTLRKLGRMLLSDSDKKSTPN